jgi:stage III sporulation protein AE
MKIMKKMFMLFACLALCSSLVFCSAEQLDNHIPKAWSDTVKSSPITVDDFKNITFEGIADYLIGIVIDTAKAPLRLFAKLCAVLIVAAIVHSFYDSDGVAQLSDTVMTLALFTLCCGSMMALLTEFSQVIEESRVYLSAFIPVFTSVLVSCGQTSGATVYNGIFFAACMLFSSALCGIGIPIIRIYLALNAITCSGGIIDASSLVTSVEKWIKWILTFIATAFAALLGMQTALAQSTDNVLLKASKFIVGSSVPVIGRAVSDAMSSVFSGLKLLKGTIGFAAIAVICALFIPLIIKFVVYHMIFSMTQVVASGVGMGKTAKLLDGFSKCISICISMLFLFLLMVVSSTMVMVLIGGSA